jgi:hypothetical protein
MLARHAVLLTSSESSRPAQLLSGKQSASITSLESTLPSSLVSVASKRLTGLLSPLDSTLPKKMVGGGRHFPFPIHSFLLPIPLSPYPPFPATYSLPFHILTNSFAFSKTLIFLESIKSKLFCQNIRGWGGRRCFLRTLRAARSGAASRSRFTERGLKRTKRKMTA